MKDISIIILTLEEEGIIGDTLKQVHQTLTELKLDYEIIVVDGGSKDKTVEIAKKLCSKVLCQEQRGYHVALKMAFKEAIGNYIVTLDADGSHPPDLIKDLWSQRHICAIVIGSRFTQGGSFSGPSYRIFLSKILNKMYQLALKMPVEDLSSGFRLYRKETLDLSSYQCKDFSILQEILVSAFSQGFSIGEVPLRYKPREWGSSKASVVKFALSYVKTLRAIWGKRFSATSADYDYRAYDSLNFVQRYWQRKRFNIIHNFLHASENGGDKLIVDIGSGSSKIATSLTNSISIDISFAKLRFLKNKGKRNVIQASTFNLPISSDSCDAMIHSQVIEHIPYDDNIFREINRILKVNGTLILGTPDYAKWQWRWTEYLYGKIMPYAYADEHITHYTFESLNNILTKFGFQVLDHSYILQGELIILAQKISNVR